MPKKVCLIEPEYGQFDFSYVPTGILTLASILEEAGCSVTICDNRNNIPSCDILGISCTIVQYKHAIDIARVADAETVVVGGAFPTTSTVEVLASSVIDLAVIGDGEQPIIDLIDGIDKKQIPGIAYKRNGSIVVNPNIDFETKLRGYRPNPPAYHLLDNKIGNFVNVSRNREYTWFWEWKRRNRPKWNRDFNKEISVLKNLGVTAVAVQDQRFGCWHKNIASTIVSLDRLDYWTCRATVESVLEDELDQKLRGSKCSQLELNILTASDRLLMENSMSLEDLNLAVKKLDDAGINVRFHAVLGLPGESIDSMMETWQWLSGKQARFSTFVPMPGDVYYEKYAAYQHFGLEIVSVDCDDFALNDVGPINRVPWKQNTIDISSFLNIRNRIIKEFTDVRA